MMMKHMGAPRTLFALPVAALFLASASVSAQSQLELPAPSPAASVQQRVGLTDISVEYSSPGVKGREIFGGLVPYNKVWRTGANAATKVTFSRDVKFGGKSVPAGTYSLVTIPTAKGWTVALNKELGFFAGGKAYHKKGEVARVPAKTTQIPARERLTFLFSDTTDDQTSLDLEWSTLRVSVPVSVDTAAHVQASIDGAVGGAWRPHVNAARYLAEHKKDYATALKYVNTSIGIESTWYNNWAKADILAKQGNYAEALKFAQVAWDLGKKDKNFFYKAAVEKALKEWKGKK